MDKKYHFIFMGFVGLVIVVGIIHSFITYGAFSDWCFANNGTIIEIGQSEFVCVNRTGGILGSLNDWMYGRKP